MAPTTKFNVNRHKFEIQLINKNLTVNELSNLSGLSNETIYRMLKEKKASIKTLGKIAKALEIDIEKVLEDVH